MGRRREKERGECISDGAAAGQRVLPHLPRWCHWGLPVSPLRQGADDPKRRAALLDKLVAWIFEKHGFIWGGEWYHYDTMHFEYHSCLDVRLLIGKGRRHAASAPVAQRIEHQTSPLGGRMLVPNIRRVGELAKCPRVLAYAMN
jgi:hypothetical protein